MKKAFLLSRSLSSRSSDEAVRVGLEWIDLFRRLGSLPAPACRGGFSAVLGLDPTTVPAARVRPLEEPTRRPPNAAPTTPATPSVGLPSGLSVSYAFPVRLASPGCLQGKPPAVSLAAVLAAFDDVSSWAFFAADRTHR